MEMGLDTRPMSDRDFVDTRKICRSSSSAVRRLRLNIKFLRGITTPLRQIKMPARLH